MTVASLAAYVPSAEIALTNLIMRGCHLVRLGVRCLSRTGDQA
jgi:hypothetical protein